MHVQRLREWNEFQSYTIIIYLITKLNFYELTNTWFKN